MSWLTRFWVWLTVMLRFGKVLLGFGSLTVTAELVVGSPVTVPWLPGAPGVSAADAKSGEPTCEYERGHEDHDAEHGRRSPGATAPVRAVPYRGEDPGRHGFRLLARRETKPGVRITTMTITMMRAMSVWVVDHPLSTANTKGEALGATSEERPEELQVAEKPVQVGVVDVDVDPPEVPPPPAAARPRGGGTSSSPTTGRHRRGIAGLRSSGTHRRGCRRSSRARGALDRPLLVTGRWVGVRARSGG